MPETLTVSPSHVTAVSARGNEAFEVTVVACARAALCASMKIKPASDRTNGDSIFFPFIM